MVDTSTKPSKRDGRPRTRRSLRSPAALPENVLLLHQRIMPRHKLLLEQWADAARRMGICDVTIYPPGCDETGKTTSGYVLIWVRENIDPAYMIRPDGTGWRIIDAVRQNELAYTRGFDSALNIIRPVLKLETAA